MGPPRVLAGVAAAWLASASWARADASLVRPQVLAEVATDAQLRLTVTVAAGDACVEIGRLAAIPPWTLQAVSTCVAELTGPAGAPRQISVDGATLAVPAAAPASPAAPPGTAAQATSAASLSPTLHLRAGGTLPVGLVVVGARLDVREAGLPRSDVELTVQAEGGRLRALRWVAPGQAEVDVLVEQWSPRLAISVAMPGQAPLTVEASIAAGPPAHATLAVPARLGAGALAPLGVVVTTRHGQPVAADRVAVRAPGCVVEAGQVRCDRPGRFALTTWALVDATWAPIDQREVVVEAPTPPPAPAPTVSWLASGWSAAGASQQGWRVGVLAAAQVALGAGWDGQLGLGWGMGQASFAPTMPVAVGLAVDEQEFALRAGARRTWRTRTSVPWTIAATTAPVLVRQRGALGADDDRSLGVRAVATATVGAQLTVASRRVWIDGGARAALDVVAPRWGPGSLAWFVEVSVAR